MDVAGLFDSNNLDFEGGGASASQGKGKQRDIGDNVIHLVNGNYWDSGNREAFNGDGDDDDDDHRDQPQNKCRRLSKVQTQQLESIFERCPNPSDEQRNEVSRAIGLATAQVKNWFQNKRTQQKRKRAEDDNLTLKKENGRLQREIQNITEEKNTLMNERVGLHEENIRLWNENANIRQENARLRDQLQAPHLHRPEQWRSIAPQQANSNIPRISRPRDDMGFIKETRGIVDTWRRTRSLLLLRHGVDALDELDKLAHFGAPMWTRSSDEEIRQVLNHEQYMRTFSRCQHVGPTVAGYVRQGSRKIAILRMNSLDVVKTLMDKNQWEAAFPSVVVKAGTAANMISYGTDGGGLDGALQEVKAQLQALLPTVPVRQVRFIRYCKKMPQGYWVVADASHADLSSPDINYWRHPSGCVIKDILDTGCCQVTWIEHYEYDESSVPLLYRTYLRSGLVFGANRWVSVLQRQSNYSYLLESRSLPRDATVGISLNQQKGLLNLAQSMSRIYFSSMVGDWRPMVHADAGRNNEEPGIWMMLRNGSDNPSGAPTVNVLHASTSIWLPVPHGAVLNYLCDVDKSGNGDRLSFLSGEGKMRERHRIGFNDKISSCRNSSAMTNGGGETMLILQEAWSDESGSLLVYSPVDVASINHAMGGGDVSDVILLTSGYVILPCSCSSTHHLSPNGGSLTMITDDQDRGSGHDVSFLTITLQILISSSHSASPQIVESVNDMIVSLIQNMKAAFTKT
ncbi:hypothetical protein SAY87_008225 [Trapa incisa]|uniref:Uncharacterized protein n=1 Tax=Trapa incisa TaxID=236973 RepID=A0AAN7KKZ0_9MYRT|nr:hypothetical protein SAY87_008225 [Trapa incisa]